MSSKGGRPMLEGVVRYQSGRINQAETRKLTEALSKVDSNRDNAPASPKVKRERDLFNAKCFKGGGQAQHAGDGIGQLWLVGKLEVPGYDDTRLLNAGRTWYRGKEVVFNATAARTANYERQDRGHGTTKASKIEREYYRYRSMLDAARKALPTDRERERLDHCVECLSDLMEPLADGSPQHWVQRIVQTTILEHFKMPIALLACDDDAARLKAAKLALIAMARNEARVERNAA